MNWTLLIAWMGSGFFAGLAAGPIVRAWRQHSYNHSFRAIDDRAEIQRRLDNWTIRRVLQLQARLELLEAAKQKGE